MEPVIFVLSIVLFAYVVAEYVFRVRRLPFFLSSFLHSGIGFILIGVFVGPLFLGWLDETKLDLFISPTYLALSWAGLVFGLQFRWSSMKLVSKANYKMAAVQSFVAFAVAALFLIPVCRIASDAIVFRREGLLVVLVLASIASVSAPTGVSAVVRRFHAHGMTARMLQYICGSNAVIGITIFGITLAFFRPDGPAKWGFVSGFVWIAVTVGVGVLLGFLYHVFLALRLSSNERLVVAVGTIVLAAGAASYIDVSPIFLSMIVGVVLANFSDSQDRLFRLLVTAERPLFGFMLILAGAHWLGFEPVGLGLGVTFVLVRAFGKMLGAKAAFKSVFLEGRDSMSFGLALTGQGGIAIAMALDFMVHYYDFTGSVVLSAIVLAFVINGIFSPYLIRRMLFLDGEIS